ncbi:hypothetical protein [Oryzobacter telluris]|uniref:PDC sensor domain-containing protein n=1 Tax=Oryzobacter telluris TaxID=3149179 RepID=UPI00370DD259
MNGSNGAVEAEARGLADRVDEVGAWVVGTVGALSSLVAGQLAPMTRRADLDIEDHCRALLEQREIPLAGAGFVAEAGALADAPYWLEWWTADPEVGAASCRRLAADTDPASVGFRDYTELPWFVTPRETGLLHVTGPYVDYVCTDQHTLTVTQPVVVGGRFVGVAGIDVLAATVERLLRDPLDTASGVLVVVNRVGRVVASSDPEHVVGDLVGGLPDDAWFTSRRSGRAGEGEPWEFVACTTVPLGVLIRL